MLTRHWIITDAEGRTEEVQGEGVVGEQPKLDSGEMFRYSSYAVIETPIGSMHGHYEFQDEKGIRFLVPIPAFSLSTQSVRMVLDTTAKATTSLIRSTLMVLVMDKLVFTMGL